MKTCLAFLVWTLMVSGCATPLSQRQVTAARERREASVLQADVARLAERVEGLAAAQERIFSELAVVRREVAAAAAADTARLAELEASLRRQESRIAESRREVVAELSEKMAQVLASRPATGGLVREHTVKSGETLSEIAAAYGISVDAIVRANNLSSANVIRVGQTLVIPL